MSVRVHGERLVEASREQVFAALTDPEVVAQTMPLVEETRVLDANRWETTIRLPPPLAKPLRLAFEVVERRPPEYARLRATGGGMLGGADVESSFELDEAPGGTLVRFTAEITFRGALAPAERLLQPLAQRQAEKTLDAIEQRVGR